MTISANVTAVQIPENPCLTILPENPNALTVAPGGNNRSDSLNSQKTIIFQAQTKGKTKKLFGHKIVPGLGQTDDFRGTSTCFVEHTKFLKRVPDKGIRMGYTGWKLIIAREDQLFPQGTLSLQIKELVNACLFWIKPCRGLLPFRDAFKHRGDHEAIVKFKPKTERETSGTPH